MFINPILITFTVTLRRSLHSVERKVIFYVITSATVHDDKRKCFHFLDNRAIQGDGAIAPDTDV